MVGISRDSRSLGTSEDFGKIELAMPGVRSSYEDAADGIAGAVPESSVAVLEVARILSQNRRQNRAGKKILDGAVSEGRAVTLAIAFGALSVAWFAIFSLADTGKEGIPGELDIVERGAGDDFELLSGGERGYLAGVLERQEIRQSEKQTVLGSALSIALVRALLGGLSRLSLRAGRGG